MSFSQPAEPNHAKITDREGRLLLIRPKEIRTEDLGYGENEVAIIDFVVLDGPDAGTKFESVLTPQRYLVASFKESLKADNNPMVLGRLVKAKKGSSGHTGWILENHTPEDAERARAYLDKGPEALKSDSDRGPAPF